MGHKDWLKKSLIFYKEAGRCAESAVHKPGTGGRGLGFVGNRIIGTSGHRVIGNLT
jgi:hypothetical protein